MIDSDDQIACRLDVVLTDLALDVDRYYIYDQEVMCIMMPSFMC